MIRLGLLLLAFLALPPLLHGAGPGTTALAAAFFLLQVLGPGWVLATVLVPARADRFERLALALVLGLAAQSLAFLAAKPLGLEHAAVAYPILLAPLLPVCTRAARAPRAAGDALGARAGLALCVLLVLCVARTPFLPPDQWWARQDADLLFHVGNAAEFARHWPIQDPRVAGTPLVYHVLSYALPAGAHVAFGAPVAELATLQYAGVGPLVLALTTFAAGRALGRDAWAGVVAAGLVVLHTDVASALRETAGLDVPALYLHSHFDVGVFHSSTTRAGLAAYAALVVLGLAWFRGDGPRGRLAVAVALVAAFASGAKGSVLPVVVAGLGLAIVVEALRSKRVPALSVGLLALVALGGAPFTLWLVGHESSYAGAMFRVAPMTPMRSAGAFVSLANAAGHEALLAPWWMVAVCAPVWWTLHAGAALVGACTGLRRGGIPLEGSALWLLGTAAAGFAAASTVAAAGYSELFFAYDGQLALAILAGVGVAGSWRSRHRFALALFAAFAVPMALAALARTAATTRAAAGAPPESALARDYRAGLAWIRDASPPDAVFVTSGSWTNVSAFGERRAFVENERFTPAWHAARWQRVAGRWVRLRGAEREPSARMAAREALRARVDAARIAALRSWVPEAPLYLVVDRLQPIPGPGLGCAVGPLPAEERSRAGPLLEPVFANGSIAIHRLR